MLQPPCRWPEVSGTCIRCLQGMQRKDTRGPSRLFVQQCQMEVWGVGTEHTVGLAPGAPQSGHLQLRRLPGGAPHAAPPGRAVHSGLTSDHPSLCANPVAQQGNSSMAASRAAVPASPLPHLQAGHSHAPGPNQNVLLIGHHSAA